jgi:hypothetical protein
MVKQPYFRGDRFMKSVLTFTKQKSFIFILITFLCFSSFTWLSIPSKAQIVSQNLSFGTWSYGGFFTGDPTSGIFGAPHYRLDLFQATTGSGSTDVIISSSINGVFELIIDMVTGCYDGVSISGVIHTKLKASIGNTLIFDGTKDVTPGHFLPAPYRVPFSLQANVAQPLHIEFTVDATEVSDRLECLDLFGDVSFGLLSHGCTDSPQAGTLTVNPSSGIAGTDVLVSGTGWVTGSNTTEYQLLFDNAPVAQQGPISSCGNTQPNMAFSIPCEARVGSHTLTNQLVDVSSGQILASAQTTITVVKAIAPAASKCAAINVQITPFIAVPKDKPINVEVMVTPASNTKPITLTLSTRKGTTGQAVFADNNSDSITITKSTMVAIKGIKESDQSDNIELQALLPDQKQPLATNKFCVLWVTVDFSNSSTFSMDNSARQEVTKLLGSDEIKVRFINGTFKLHTWSTVVELVGKVMPADYKGELRFKRVIVEEKIYNDKRQVRQQTDQEDISLQAFLDEDPKPKGQIYDIDAPGIAITGATAPFGTIFRKRVNFRQFVTALDIKEPDGSSMQVSNDFRWFSRVSVIKLENSNNEFKNELDSSLPGDNMAGAGTTNITWDLQ